jgi:hypothetical protein
MLYSLLEKSDLLEEGRPGYARAKELDGVVIEAIGADGTPLVFVGVRGGEVSNDHYPYYEFLYSGQLGGGWMELLSADHSYFDVAGIEGIEWPEFFLIILVLELLPLAIVMVAIRRKLAMVTLRPSR